MAPAELLTWAVLLTQLVAIAWIDGRSRRIPNRLNAALLLTGLAAARVDGGPGLTGAVAGVALGGCFLLTVALVYRRLRGIDGLGFGDVKFLSAAGAWVGWQGVGPLVFIAASATLLWVFLRRQAGAVFDDRDLIPFGPFLCAALLVVRLSQSR